MTTLCCLLFVVCRLAMCCDISAVIDVCFDGVEGEDDGVFDHAGDGAGYHLLP